MTDMRGRLHTEPANAAWLRALFVEHADEIYSFCASRAASPQDADDACQEVFLRAGLNRAKVEAHPAVAGWLMVTARNVISEQLRRRRREIALLDDATRPRQELRATPLNAPTADLRPDEHAVNEEARRELRSAISGLGPSHQEVLWPYLQGLTTAEIAATILKSEQATKSQLHRARAQLASEFRRRGMQAG